MAIPGPFAPWRSGEASHTTASSINALIGVLVAQSKRAERTDRRLAAVIGAVVVNALSIAVLVYFMLVSAGCDDDVDLYFTATAEEHDMANADGGADLDVPRVTP